MATPQQSARSNAVWKLQKERLSSLLKTLMQTYTVFAPIKQDETRYEELATEDAIKDITLEEFPLFPAKKIFFPKEETLFHFKGNTLTPATPQKKPKVVFGLRRCDLNAIAHQDIAFTTEHPDPYYQARRDETVLIGIHCATAYDEYCFCGSLNLDKNAQDIMLYPKADHYLLEATSNQGEQLLNNLAQTLPDTLTPTPHSISDEEKTTPGTNNLATINLNHFINNKQWEEPASRCIDCAACNTLCPTCYCFEIHDTSSLPELTKGKRERKWSACMTPSFTRVAGDHIFRHELLDRFKHRIYHQLQWFKDRFGVHLCVGCGRCIRGCPERIDFRSTINAFKENTPEENTP
ncbi:hypothetical protein D6783_00590 [Candidatus Woesearchaeota archaeon]|nr:MAG: hypothetical protein D6783_00590 [Candidatus Woesearchaeota archaeon]